MNKALSILDETDITNIIEEETNPTINMTLLSYKIKSPGSRRWNAKSAEKIAEINAKFAHYQSERSRLSQVVQHSTDAANTLVVNSGKFRQDISRISGIFANNGEVPSVGHQTMSASTITVMNWPQRNQNINYDGAVNLDLAHTTGPL